MDPSATPWRVLEDPPTPDAGRRNERGGEPRERSHIPRSVVLVGGLAVLLVVGAFVLATGSGSAGGVTLDGGTPLTSGDRAADGSAAPRGSSDGRLVVVEVGGAISRPGVYRLPAGSRVGDLVTVAGGFGPRVDTERAGRQLNLAAPLRDGDQVRVPSRDDLAEAAGPGNEASKPGASAGPSGPIDLNRATAAQLDTLPGIGPATAAKIIASREGQPFAAVEDLRTRKLVGEKTFEKLRDLVAVP